MIGEGGGGELGGLAPTLQGSRTTASAIIGLKAAMAGAYTHAHKCC